MPIAPVTTFRLLLAAFIWSLAGPCGAAELLPLLLDKTIPLTNVSGRIDHMAYDPGHQRLFVAELGNDSVDVIDLATGRAIHRITGLKQPQGIGYAPGLDLIVVANAGDGSVQMFRGSDFAPAGSVALGKNADNVRVDPAGERVFVGYGTGGIAVIDTTGPDIVSQIALPGHPEGFQLDPAGQRVFVNLPESRQIAVHDVATGNQVAIWQVPGLRSNFPMALDPSGTIIATAFRTPPRLVLLDAQSGAVVANVGTCGGADDIFFDESRQRIYVICGEGAVDVFRKVGTGYRVLDQVRTAPNARTALFVPALDRLFVAATAGYLGFGRDAAILVFRPQP
jgi:YVTN family beta-propeller protein